MSSAIGLIHARFLSCVISLIHVRFLSCVISLIHVRFLSCVISFALGLAEVKGNSEIAYLMQKVGTYQGTERNCNSALHRRHPRIVSRHKLARGWCIRALASEFHHHISYYIDSMTTMLTNHHLRQSKQGRGGGSLDKLILFMIHLK